MSSSRSWPCAALPLAELAPRTTLRVGGRARWLLEPADPDELVAGWRAAVERGHRPRLLGGGANLIIEDGVHEGVVIATERLARVFRPAADGSAAAPHAPEDGADPFPRELAAAADDPRLVAWAGAGLPGLVRSARDLGLTGLEGLVGVPGQLGGGVAMNAGGRWGEMWDVVESVRLLLPDGELVQRERADCRPRYRDGGLGEAVVVGAVLRLAPGSRREIGERMRQYLAEKSAAQPVTERSCGCIFQNPDPALAGGRSAGKLIEDCGGKGLAQGDALVSPKHGNFIVNRGRASSADVLGLVERLQHLVEERAGVRLEREAKVWRAGEAR